MTSDIKHGTPRCIKYAECYEMSVDAIDLKLERGQAQPLRPADVRDWSDSPAIKALSELERDVYRMRSRGLKNVEIAGLCSLRRDQVCRLIQGIVEKINYLDRFRELLKSDCHAYDLFCLSANDKWAQALAAARPEWSVEHLIGHQRPGCNDPGPEGSR